MILLKSSVLLCVLYVKGFNAKDIHKEMLPFYGGKRLWPKAVHNLFDKLFQDVPKSQMMLDEVRKWLRQESKDFYALVKRWDKCVTVGGGYVEKCFPMFEYHTFYILYPFVT
jgi:hypothetical protein